MTHQALETFGNDGLHLTHEPLKLNKAKYP